VPNFVKATRKGGFSVWYGTPERGSFSLI
jgi:hypothetical protein